MSAPKPKALMSWSSGKDSAYALHLARQAGEYEIVGLLTTLTRAYQRVSMHGVREELLEAQAAAVGLPLTKIEIPAPCPPEVYAEKMRAAMDAAKAQGIRHVVFGDLYLEGIREYRETQLASVGMEAVFPLWGRDTRELAREMMGAGLRTVLTCVDPKVLPASFSGREWDARLLDELPDGVDPCGEKGEFHSFVHAGPMFSAPIAVQKGETVTREGFVFTDFSLAR